MRKNINFSASIRPFQLIHPKLNISEIYLEARIHNKIFRSALHSLADWEKQISIDIKSRQKDQNEVCNFSSLTISDQDIVLSKNNIKLIQFQEELDLPIEGGSELEIRLFAELPHENKLIGVSIFNLESYQIGNDNLVHLTTRYKKEALLGINLKLEDIASLCEVEQGEVFEQQFTLKSYRHKSDTRILEKVDRMIAETKKEYMNLVDLVSNKETTDSAPPV